MTAVPVDGVGPSPLRRATALVVLGVSVASGGAAITMLSLTMRSVTEIGGSCSDGGPYVSAQACPSGTGTALLLVFAGTFVFVIGTLWAAAVLHAPVPMWLSWPALFLTLGWNFLEDGIDPPMGEGVVVGFVVCGVLFVLMGATPLLIWASVARENRRKHRAQDAAQAGSSTTVPARRPQVGAVGTAARPEPAARPAGPASRAPVPAGSVAGQLERLAALHASGALTDDEYRRAKQATLDEGSGR